jgi:hypothetical protein
MRFYEYPLFVDLLLWTVYVLLAITVGLTLWSMLRSPSRLWKGGTLPAWIAFALLVLTLAVTCLLANTTPIVINGKTYADALWLRVSDMLIYTSLFLIFVAVLGVAFGMSGLSRRIHLTMSRKPRAESQKPQKDV